MPDDDRDRRTALLIFGLLGATVVVLLAQPLLGQRSLIATDQMLGHPPWSADAAQDADRSPGPSSDTWDIWDPQRQVFADHARDGDLALWTPYASGGAPLAAEPSTGTFGPFQLTYLLLPLWYAPVAVKLAELVVSIGFSFLFLRSVGLSRTAGAIGGAIYAFNGFQLVWTNWPQTRVGALVPVLFWAVERLLRRRNAPAVAVLALVVGAMFLEGFPAVTLASLFAAGVYAAVRCLAEAGGRAQVLRGLGLAAAGVVLGVGLAAIQLLPFQERLPDLDLQRDQGPNSHLDALVAATLAVPNAFGAPQDDPYRLQTNYVEALSYVGAAACVLALAMLVLPRAGTVRRGVRWFAAGAAAVLLMLIFVGGPLLGLLQNFPPLDTNAVSRLRSLLAFFLAVMAALGVEAILTRKAAARPADGRVTTWRDDRHLPRLALGAVLLVVVAAGVVKLLRSISGGNYLSEAAGDLAVGGVLVAMAVAAVGVALRWPRWRAPGMALLAVLVVGQALQLWSSYLPESRRDEWFRRTPMHEFLQENLGSERVATVNPTLLAGSTVRYRIRTVTGHVFTQPTWKDLLQAVDPDAFARSPTLSQLSSGPGVAESPVLDRMAARYYADSEYAEVLGTHQPASVDATAEPVVLGPDDATTVPVITQRLRGVELVLTEPLVTPDPRAWLRVTVRAEDGTVVARGSRHLVGAFDGAVMVPVAAEEATLASPTALTLEIALDADDDQALASLATTAAGQVAVGTVSGDDEMRLVFSDGGQLYERLTALDRVRWADRAEVVADDETRIERLREGVPADTVLLDQPASSTSSADDEAASADGATPADVRLVEDGLDTQVVEVDADDAGYLVVADANQLGWEATLDGEPTTLLPADHAMGAVRVPAGRHEVRLSFEPPGLGPGRVITALSLAVVLGLFVVTAVRDRRAGRRRDAPSIGS